MFRGLNQIRLQGILEDHAKDPMQLSSLQKPVSRNGCNRLLSFQALPKIFHILGQAMIVITSEANDIETGRMRDPSNLEPKLFPLN